MIFPKVFHFRNHQETNAAVKTYILTDKTLIVSLYFLFSEVNIYELQKKKEAPDVTFLSRRLMHLFDRKIHVELYNCIDRSFVELYGQITALKILIKCNITRMVLCHYVVSKDAFPFSKLKCE